MQLTRSLQAPGFINPCAYKVVISWFQAFAFQIVQLVPLQRGGIVGALCRLGAAGERGGGAAMSMVGRVASLTPISKN
jgi:hypothetical protein